MCLRSKYSVEAQVLGSNVRIFRMSGIERDIFIWSQPKTSIKDFRVVSTLNDTYKDGVFKLGVDLRNSNSADKNVTKI